MPWVCFKRFNFAVVERSPTQTNSQSSAIHLRGQRKSKHCQDLQCFCLGTGSTCSKKKGSTGENWKNNILIYTQGTGIWQEVLLWRMTPNLHLMFHGMRRLHCQEFMDRIAEDTWTCATRLTKVVQNRMIQPYDCKISGLSIRVSVSQISGFLVASLLHLSCLPSCEKHDWLMRS